MKSPLVDALRQASSDSSPDSAEESPSESVVGQSSETAESQTLQPMELDLLETGRYEAVVAHAADTPSGLETTPDAVESLSAHERTAGAPEPTAPDLEVTAKRKDIIVKIGRTCPILCVIALIASAGTYLVLNDLSLLDLNQNLSMFSASGESPGSPRTGDTGEVSLPTTGVSVFEQFLTRPVDNPTDTPTLPLPAENLIPVSPRSSTVPVDERGIAEPAIARNKSDAVRDSAYASVLAAYEAYHRGEFHTAEKQYGAALDIEPNHRAGLAGLAAVYLQTGRTGLAATTYERLLAIDPQNTAAAAAILAIRSADVAWEIESELKLLLQRFPDSHHLHNALGSVFVDQHKWPEAKHEFLTAHKLAPDNADYSYNTAVSLDRMGQQSAAQVYYALALEAANDESAFDRSAILAHREQFERRKRERL